MPTVWISRCNMNTSIGISDLELRAIKHMWQKHWLAEYSSTATFQILAPHTTLVFPGQLCKLGEVTHTWWPLTSCPRSYQHTKVNWLSPWQAVRRLIPPHVIFPLVSLSQRSKTPGLSMITDVHICLSDPIPYFLSLPGPSSTFSGTMPLTLICNRTSSLKVLFTW